MVTDDQENGDWRFQLIQFFLLGYESAVELFQLKLNVDAHGE